MYKEIKKEWINIIKSRKLQYIAIGLMVLLIGSYVIQAYAESIYFLVPASLIYHVSKIAVGGILFGVIGVTIILIKQIKERNEE